MATWRMSRTRLVWRQLASLAFILLLAAVAGADEGGEAADDRLATELAAGEFSAVRQAANGEEEPARRDQILEELAVAQARAGAARGSAESIRAIVDPSVRQRAIGAIHATDSGNLAGGSQADFESLIQLIQSTISPDSWDVAGGPGAITEFAGGVFVDAGGVLRKLEPVADEPEALESLFDRGRSGASDAAMGNVRRESDLRYVSLPRLEREIELCRFAGEPLDESMRMLAGLKRVQYVFVYPETGDLVLAGPAGNWREQDDRMVSVATGAPIVRLDDLILLMRRAKNAGADAFGCSITPKQENLARTQEYLAATTDRPLRAGERDEWIAGIRDALGRQDISIFGLDSRTRVARVLVEADYHMKLIGMGLAEGVPGVESYLDTVPVGADDSPPPMSVLRWWFALNYSAINTTRDRLAFELQGPGVRVLSENELLAERGQRIHTGASDEPTARFAATFTDHFDELSRKYPVYAELRHLFDLALVVALCEEHGLYEQAKWQAAAMLDPGRLPLAPAAVPREVESVVNHRVVGGKHILVGVSGGVSVETSALVKGDALETDDYGPVRANHRPLPRGFGGEAWWWDR